MHRGKYRMTAAAAAVAIAAGAFAAVAIPSSAGAADASVALAGSAATPLPAGAVRLGALAPTTGLTIDVTLKLGNQAGLDALVAGLANPKSPYFGRFVGKDQFGPEFGLSPAAIARVSSTLREHGPAHRQPSIPTGSTSRHRHRGRGQRAFGVAAGQLPAARRPVAYANSAAPKDPGVDRPGDRRRARPRHLYQPHALSHQSLRHEYAQAQRAGRGQPRGERGARAHGAQFRDRPGDRHDGFTANQLAAHYEMTSLYKVSDFGLGAECGGG